MEFEANMREALRLAGEAAAAGEVPVGCVISDESGRIIGRGRNMREEKRSACSHAEMEAIAMACASRGDWRLDGCTMFVTLEPCPMCAGAIINARIKTLVYGAREASMGSCASVINLFEERYPHRPAIYAGILESDCGALMSDFFTRRRGK